MINWLAVFFEFTALQRCFNSTEFFGKSNAIIINALWSFFLPLFWWFWSIQDWVWTTTFRTSWPTPLCRFSRVRWSCRSKMAPRRSSTPTTRPSWHPASCTRCWRRQRAPLATCTPTQDRWRPILRRRPTRPPPPPRRLPLRGTICSCPLKNLWRW